MNEEGDKIVDTRVLIPIKDEGAEAKDEGGKEVNKEVKLHETETNPKDKE